MFSTFNGPSIFENLPNFAAFGMRHPSFFAQEPCYKRPCTKTPPSSSSLITRFTTQSINGGAILTMKKHIPASHFKAAVQRRLYEIKENYSRRPGYRLVTDIFGNRYYVDDREQLRAQMAHEMESIDTRPIARQVAKLAFKDYELELEHNGLLLHVRSSKDNIDREFEFGGCVIEDFSLVGLTMESDDVAILKIRLTFQNCGTDGNNRDDKKEKRIRNVEVKGEQELAEEHKKNRGKNKNTETTTTAAAATTFVASNVTPESKKVSTNNNNSSSTPSSASPKKIRRRNSDIIKAKRLAAQAAARERARLELAQQKKKRQEEQQRKALEEAERARKSREQLLKEQIEYQRQLVEEERQRRADLAFNSSDSGMSDTESVSSVNGNEQGTSTSGPLSKTVSPVLEDVDDEELERYNESVRRNSGSRSIIEDA